MDKCQYAYTKKKMYLQCTTEYYWKEKKRIKKKYIYTTFTRGFFLMIEICNGINNECNGKQIFGRKMSNTCCYHRYIWININYYVDTTELSFSGQWFNDCLPKPMLENSYPPWKWCVIWNFIISSTSINFQRRREAKA